MRNTATIENPTAKKGERNNQRKMVRPSEIGRPCDMGEGNQCGSGTPMCSSVEARTKRTNTETIPFQNRQKRAKPAACPADLCVAPITCPTGSRLDQAPSGGRLKSTSSSMITPEVKAESECERLHVRQNAMSLATLISALGITPLQCGQ